MKTEKKPIIKKITTNKVPLAHVGHLFETNNLSIFKIYSDIPRIWINDNLIIFLHSSNINKLIYTIIVRDTTTRQSKRFGFAYIFGLQNFRQFCDLKRLWELNGKTSSFYK